MPTSLFNPASGRWEQPAHRFDPAARLWLSQSVTGKYGESGHYVTTHDGHVLFIVDGKVANGQGAHSGKTKSELSIKAEHGAEKPPAGHNAGMGKPVDKPSAAAGVNWTRQPDNGGRRIYTASAVELQAARLLTRDERGTWWLTIPGKGVFMGALATYGNIGFKGPDGDYFAEPTRLKSSSSPATVPRPPEWTTPSGNRVSVSIRDHQLHAHVHGATADPVPATLAATKMLPNLPSAVARQHEHALMFTVNGKPAVVPVPREHSAGLRKMVDDAEAARPKSHDEQRESLVAAYEAAKHAAERAKESAYKDDTGRGFKVVADLEEKAEKARQAVIAHGD